jgi:RES domain-containing protein
VLEALVHVSGLSALGTLENVLIPVEFEDSLISEVGTLPPDWDASPAPFSAAAIGDHWVASGRSLILRVPSAVLSLEDNYLLNPAHPEMSKVMIGSAVPVIIDIRLQKLYPGSPGTGTIR